MVKAVISQITMQIPSDLIWIFCFLLQELLTLPALVRKSEVVMNFFGALNGQNGTIER